MGKKRWNSEGTLTLHIIIQRAGVNKAGVLSSVGLLSIRVQDKLQDCFLTLRPRQK